MKRRETVVQWMALPSSLSTVFLTLKDATTQNTRSITNGQTIISMIRLCLSQIRIYP